MIIHEAVKILSDMGAKQVRNGMLRDVHGFYACMMFTESEPNFEKTFIVEKQKFAVAGAYPEKGMVTLQRALLTMSEVENIPVVVVLFGYMDGERIYMYHPDEVLTKYRDNLKNVFGVINIEFKADIGEKIRTEEDLKGLKEKWQQKKIDWTEKRKQQKQTNLKRYN